MGMREMTTLDPRDGVQALPDLEFVV